MVMFPAFWLANCWCFCIHRFQKRVHWCQFTSNWDSIYVTYVLFPLNWILKGPVDFKHCFFFGCCRQKEYCTILHINWYSLAFKELLMFLRWNCIRLYMLFPRVLPLAQTFKLSPTVCWLNFLFMFNFYQKECFTKFLSSAYTMLS